MDATEWQYIHLSSIEEGALNEVIFLSCSSALCVWEDGSLDILYAPDLRKSEYGKFFLNSQFIMVPKHHTWFLSLVFIYAIILIHTY